MTIVYTWFEWAAQRPSEKEEIEALKLLKHYDSIDDIIVVKHFRSEKAIELYNKIKRVRNIIK